MRCRASACPPEVSVACTAAALILRGSLSPAEQQSPPPPPLCACSPFVRWGFFLCTVANYVCFVSFSVSSPTSPPQTSFCFFNSSSLQPFLSLNVLLLLSCHLYLSEHSTQPQPQPHRTPVCWPLAVLCCGGPQKRSGQMVSEDFRALLISTGTSLVLLLLLLLP